MSDSEEPTFRRKRKVRRIDDGPSSSTGRTQRAIISDSSSDSDSSLEFHHRRKRLRIVSDHSSESSGSDIIMPNKRTARVVSDSDSDSESDPGFEGSSSSLDTDDSERKVEVKPIQDTGVDSDSSTGDSEKCPICLLSLKSQEVASPITCAHLFCLECILEWSKNVNTCPVDRQEYRRLLVRRKIGENVHREVEIEPPAPAAPELVNIVVDPTICEVCRLGDREDRMLLCDGCDSGYHMECLRPPLQEVPETEWFCADCALENQPIDREINLEELEFLLDDAANEGRPVGRRRRATPGAREAPLRLIPRTRQSERVRTQIEANRLQAAPPSTSQPRTARPKKKKKKSRRKPRPRYRTIYEIDPNTGETIAVKKRIARRKKRRRAKKPAKPKSVRSRLAQHLGMCRPKSVPFSLPDVRPQNRTTAASSAASLPRHSFQLFGPAEDMVLFSDSDQEGFPDGGGALLRRRAPNRSDVAALRRQRTKTIALPTVSSTSSTLNLLDTILNEQTRLYAKPNLNANNETIRSRPNYTETTGANDSVPSSSGNARTYEDRPTSTNSGENHDESVPETSNTNFNGSNDSSDCNQAEVSSEMDDPCRNKAKKSDESDDSDIDIYDDIETVSTTKNDCKSSPSPINLAPASNNDSDEDDSEDDAMVIDTQEENAKEETTVTSTVDSNEINAIGHPTVTSSSNEIQSEAVQSSSMYFSDNAPNKADEDDSSGDECPNFSIYSKESITMAKNTDISLGVEPNPPETNQSGEVSSMPIRISSNLYSDSEDESIIKRGVENSFGISDIRNMTEDISEDERSYTPCLDERGPGIEGLDTEMISDEERNDFDEVKAISDCGGDALEINAKESELDFSRPEDCEEGEIVDRMKKQKTEETPPLECPLPLPEPSRQIEENAEEIRNTENEPTKKPENEKPPENEVKTATKPSSATTSFKRLSKNSKERNYRDKERSKSHEKKSSKTYKEPKQREKDKIEKNKKEKRTEIQRYNVRAIIKPRRAKDKFGRDIRRSASRSSGSKSPKRRSASKKRSPPARKKRRSPSRSRSRTPRTKKRKRSRTPLRKKSRERSKNRKNNKARHRSRTESPPQAPKRAKAWPKRRESHDWTPSPSPEVQHASPSWTPPRLLDASVKPHNLTVILTNETNKKKKDKKKKGKDGGEKKKRKREQQQQRTPPPSKEVFASGDNILVSVSFNKESQSETRDVSTKRKGREQAVPAPIVEEAQGSDYPLRPLETPKAKKRLPKPTTTTSIPKKDISGIKPVAIIDLDRSPFKELTPSPRDIIILSDSDSETKQKCDSTEQSSPQGPKTPPEPQVKFTLATQTNKMRAITNPLHEPEDIPEEEEEEEEEEEDETTQEEHKGPNTPPDSAPSSPDAYDPFEPTKSGTTTPEPGQQTIQATPKDDVAKIDEGKVSSTPEKSHTPPLIDIQAPDSQSSSVHASPESCKSSPEPSTSLLGPGASIGHNNGRLGICGPSVESATPTSLIVTSTPTTILTTTVPRISILNNTILTQAGPQRIILSPVKATVATKGALKAVRKSSGSRNGDSVENSGLSLDSPYSPGSSDYEDLFEPPVEGGSGAGGGNTAAETVVKKATPATTTPMVTKAAVKSVVKSPSKAQNAFDVLFGSSPMSRKKSEGKGKYGGSKKTTSKGRKEVGVKLDEDNLKIMDDLPNSAVEMQVKDKFLKKLNRQERVVEEVKLVLKPHYNKKHVTKDEYKDILRRAVPKICHNKSGEINPTKIKNLIEAYVKKVRHSKKVTSSSSINSQKN